MAIGTATILRTPIREDPTQGNLVGIKERHHLVIEQIRSRQGALAVVELGKGHLTIGIDEGLLVETAYPLQRPDIERILRATIARTFALKFPMRFFFDLRLL